MAHPAPLIQRLQLHQGKTRRMLTPGIKDSTGQHNPVASGLNAWGAQKYSQIAQNMRFLRGERLGNFSPEKINLIGMEIPAKFADPASLLHIKSASAQKDSIWSEVEQALPAGEPAAPDARIPTQETGIMRAGTVIQRMPTVPRPGQSIESFKEQIQARAATKPKTPVRTPPRPNDPSVRRYARIEEIHQKPTAVPAEDLPNQDSPPTAESAPNDTIRRQAEQSTDLPLAPERSASQPKTKPKPPVQTPELPAPVSEASRLPKLPTETTQVDVPPLPREPKPPGKEARASATPTKPETPDSPQAKTATTPEKPAPTQIPQPPAPAAKPLPAPPPQASDTDERAALPRLSFSQSKGIAPEAPFAEKMPLREKSLPRARPTLRPGPSATQTPDRSLPQAKATSTRPRSQPAITRAEPRRQAASQPPISGVSPPILQRQPDKVPTPPTLPTPPVRRPESGPSDDSRPAPPLESPEQTNRAALTSLDMPAIQYRREAPKQVRTLDAKSIKPVVQPEMLKPFLPLIQRTLESPRPETKPASPQADENLPVSRTKPSLSYAQPQNAQPALATIPMPVAHLPQPAPAMISQSTPPPLQQPPAAETAQQPTSLPEIAPAPVKTVRQNVVQRLWDEHSPPASASGKGSNAGSGESSQAGSALDLDKIAEEVLPIVKRLIEIESERSAGYLR
ncbi:MAG: hypothetical protein R6W69_02455 [Anaerolineales bacterium]